MRIKFLGTGASEGIPSMFCDCEVCRTARKLKGKEIRARMGMLIDDDLMIDFSPDLFLNSVRYEIDFSNLKGILLTHSHKDHLDIENIKPRILLENEETVPSWSVFGGRSVVKYLEGSGATANLTLHELVYSEPFIIGEYRVVAFHSTHLVNEDSMVFLIQKNGKSYLHLCDTGELAEDVYEYLKENKVVIDAVAFDCTYGILKEKYFGHLNLGQIVEICDRFKKLKIFTRSTGIYLTHICHWGGTHEQLEKEAAGYGIKVAYDGLELEI